MITFTRYMLSILALGALVACEKDAEHQTTITVTRTGDSSSQSVSWETSTGTGAVEYLEETLVSRQRPNTRKLIGYRFPIDADQFDQLKASIAPLREEQQPRQVLCELLEPGPVTSVRYGDAGHKWEWTSHPCFRGRDAKRADLAAGRALALLQHWVEVVDGERLVRRAVAAAAVGDEASFKHLLGAPIDPAKPPRMDELVIKDGGKPCPLGAVQPVSSKPGSSVIKMRAIWKCPSRSSPDWGAPPNSIISIERGQIVGIRAGFCCAT